MAQGSAFAQNGFAWFTTAAKMKRRMLAKRLTRARAKCPHCAGGELNAAISGTRNHISIRCSTPGCVVLME